MKTKSKVHSHSGGRKVKPGAMQSEARHGRSENVKHKSNFKSAAFVKNDPNAGRATPLLTQHQNAAPPKEKADA